MNEFVHTYSPESQAQPLAGEIHIPDTSAPQPLPSFFESSAPREILFKLAEMAIHHLIEESKKQVEEDRKRNERRREA